MSNTIMTFEYLKSELFRYAELFQIETQKDSLDWNELVFLNLTMNTHIDMMIQKLNEENPLPNGKIRGDIFTTDEIDRLDELRRIDNNIVDQIEAEMGPVWG